MEAISEVFQQMMKENPQLEQRMRDAQNSLGSRGIECATTPSDACPNKKCDGSGFLWYIDYHKKMHPEKVAEDIRKHSELYGVAHEANDQQEMDRINSILVDLKKESEWWKKCDCHEQKQKEQEIAEKLDLSGIPDIFKGAKLNDFRTEIYPKEEDRTAAKLARKSAANYVANYEQMKAAGKGLYFYSEVKGSGKTRIASSIANALINMYNVNVVFIKAADISLQVRKTFKKNAETSEEEVLRIFKDVNVLVIDDFAVENNTDFMEELLTKILDYRMEAKNITLITSNITQDDINNLYKDGRVKSRVKKMCYEVIMPEESIRDEEARRENESLERILFA